MNEDKIITKLLEHDEQFKTLTPLVEESRAFRDEVTLANEQMLTILKRLDEERHFTAAWIQRVEEDLKQTKETVAFHQAELQAVKARLAM